MTDEGQCTTLITVGGANPGEVVLGCIRKHPEQSMRSKAVGSVPPQPLPQPLLPDSLLEFLPRLPFMTDRDTNQDNR